MKAQAQRAQSHSASSQQALRKAVNDQTLLVSAGHAAHSYVAMTYDIAAMLGQSADLRIVPIMGGGGLDNLRDILFLRGIDLAIVPANVLAGADANGTFGGNLPERLTYVTRLYGEELHLLAGSSIRTIADLAGKKIAVPAGDGNAAFTAADLLRRLGIEAAITQMDAVGAVDQIRSGQLSAALFVGGKPLRFIAGLPKDGSLRFVELRYAPALEDAYAPATLRATDYPTLLPPGTSVETISISAVLMAGSVKTTDSFRRVAKFVPSFFDGLTGFAMSRRHPKWSEVNLGAELAGWSRFPAAQEWLDNAKEQQSEWLQKRFDAFLRVQGHAGAPLSEANRRKLFDDFMKWTRKSLATAEPAQ